MNIKELEQKIREKFAEDMKLMCNKNHDYAEDEDALSNLREFGFLGVVVRLGDKFHRLKTFAEKGTYKTKGENVLDTLRDVRVYCYLAEILLEEK